jgi:predicted HNH restriction endonuclease
MTSAYIIFIKKNHSIVSKQNPGLKMTEISSILGKKWKEMSPEEKKQYQDEADLVPKKTKADKKVAKDAKATKATKATKVKKSETDVKKPKKKLNSYIKFAQQQRTKIVSENPGIKITEVSKKLGEAWRSLSEEEKAKYK